MSRKSHIVTRVFQVTYYTAIMVFTALFVFAVCDALKASQEHANMVEVKDLLWQNKNLNDENLKLRRALNGIN